jgi:hypothetical protein
LIAFIAFHEPIAPARINKKQISQMIRVEKAIGSLIPMPSQIEKETAAAVSPNFGYVRPTKGAQRITTAMIWIKSRSNIVRNFEGLFLGAIRA